MNLDEWFAQIRARYAGHMQCGKGCTACCYGLFDITLSDAADIAKGFAGLPENARNRVYSKASDLHCRIREITPGQSTPTIFPEDDPRLDRIIDAVAMAPCPCLGDAGECLIYENRPLACRLEGVPMVDVQDGLFGDWCELNFKEGVPEKALTDLKQDYNRIDQLQEDRSAAVARRAGISDHRSVTLIPSVIAEHEGFWKRASGGK